tara:strand:- start:190 stop:519 length:330 start_codon:yes stop_codon:yes gene_type:complete
MSKEVEPTFRVQVLKEAAQLITVDRAATHGSAFDNFTLIAQYWSSHVNARHGTAIDLKANDVCDMMELLKLGRRNSKPGNIENASDGCGYGALSYEMHQVLLQMKEAGN